VRACRRYLHARRPGRLPVLAGVALLLVGLSLLSGGGLVAQTPVPTAYPNIVLTPGPDFTNVGVTYYVDIGIGYSAAKTSAHPSIG
jgi:hypothetical protein